VKQKVFKILLEAKDHLSGEEISERLGVSRTAIWKHINALKEDGYDIEAVPRKGYLLKNRVDKLLRTEIITELNLKHWNKENIYTYDQVDSTNIIGKKFAAEGKEEGTFIIAEEQTKGKGRMGRDWVSPYGKGIWLSFILRPEIIPLRASEITFVIAVGIMEGIKKHINKEVKIKWPNDILLDGKKIVGILTEISAEMERINYIVAGIGINANQDIEDFPEDIRVKATSLRLNTGKYINRNELLRELIEEMERIYFIYKNEGFKKILEFWKENNATLGRRVKAITFDGEITGVAERIDDEGYLIILDDQGNENKILAGDVSLRNEDGSYF
jgi:BirA family biotin operon repressor/biotin-[acetyl-CoA-carboxylase] ligase